VIPDALAGALAGGASALADELRLDRLCETLVVPGATIELLRGRFLLGSAVFVDEQTVEFRDPLGGFAGYVSIADAEPSVVGVAGERGRLELVREGEVAVYSEAGLEGRVGRSDGRSRVFDPLQRAELETDAGIYSAAGALLCLRRWRG
jgi:hypothetical protein